ncbi:MAG: 4Fe-4S binding protein, partial [Kiritimatiellae bacterium]|nr:4Fe-4S binding protein [Kiritimatiellia bacterium]
MPHWKEVRVLAYKIDESKCTNCGLCEPNCPV